MVAMGLVSVLTVLIIKAYLENILHGPPESNGEHFIWLVVVRKQGLVGLEGAENNFSWI